MAAHQAPWDSPGKNTGVGKESWVSENWCFWTVVLEKTLESPLDCKEIQPVHPKGNQSWMFIGRTDAEAEIPILWPPDAKNRLIGKDPDAGKDWRQEEKGMPHSSTLAWKIPWMEEPVGCRLWGRTESDTTERLHFHFSLSCIREGNGNPLQCSCLESPRDGGAWWAAVYGVAQSRTRLKQLSSSKKTDKTHQALC